MSDELTQVCTELRTFINRKRITYMCGADVRRLRALLTRSVLSRCWHTLPPVALPPFKRAWVTILRGMLEHTAGECFAKKNLSSFHWILW
eukprot:COSAG01_NODE_1945_length_8831_cov_4.250000_6_plen_90_part_00